jgi:hypothetical protein
MQTQSDETNDTTTYDAIYADLGPQGDSSGWERRSWEHTRSGTSSPSSSRRSSEGRFEGCNGLGLRYTPGLLRRPPGTLVAAEQRDVGPGALPLLLSCDASVEVAALPNVEYYRYRSHI